MKKHDNMGRRMALLVALAALAAVSAVAQELNINRLFTLYGHARGCKMVEMRPAKLKGYVFNVYQSLTYDKSKQVEVDKMLEADRKHAKKIREVVDDGRIVSGYYMMPPLPNANSRYILFCNAGGGRGAVIYIEGRLSPDDIMTICYGK